MNRVLIYYENNGYPFATVKLDSVKIAGEDISAQLKVTKNKFIVIDSVLVKGNSTIKKNFLYHYLQIKPGIPYNEKNLASIGGKIRQLPFLKEKQPQLVKINDKSTKLYLFLDKKNASQFDGILGILPDNKGKTLITGDVKIKLVNNVFRAGETLELNWRRLQAQTQDLKIKAVYPYLFNTPVGVSYSLKLYKRDTTFIDILNNVGLQYIFKGLNNFNVFFKQRDANLLSTSKLAGLTVLPEYADIKTSSYGLGFFYESLDYKFNPRSGISINLSGSVGERRIRKNPKISDVVYKNLILKSNQYQVEGEVFGYIPILKRSTIKVGAQAGTVNGTQLFKNELFRIGGLRSLRGVDEESIFASSFVIPTLEYRFLLEQNSALYLFADGAWYENASVNTYFNDIPYSFGAGISFETKAGIFSLNYALGKQFSNPIDLRSGKIHFGIVNQF